MSSDLSSEAEKNALQYLGVVIPATLDSLKLLMNELTATHPTGYLIQLLKDVLSKDYARQEEVLKMTLLSFPSKESVLSFFENEHKVLRTTMVEMYNGAKQKALQHALSQVNNILQQMFSKDNFYSEPKGYLEGLASSVRTKVLRQFAEGWLLPTSVVTSDPDVTSQLLADKKFRTLLRNKSKTAINILQTKQLEGILKHATRTLDVALKAKGQEMVSTRPAGYLMVQLEQTLNQEYYSIKNILEAQLEQSPYATATLDRFDTACASLRTRMIDRYNAAKKAALSLALNQASDAIDAYLKKFDVNDLWRDVPLEECEDKLNTCLKQLARDVESSVLQKCATGWLLTAQGSPLNTSDPEVVAQVAREQTFLAKLHKAIHCACDAFSRHWLQDVQLRVKQAKAREELMWDESWRFHPGATMNFEERKGTGENGRRSTSDQKRCAAARTAQDPQQPKYDFFCLSTIYLSFSPCVFQHFFCVHSAVPAPWIHKWIRSGEGKALVVHKVPSIFSPVAKNPCNLISIFGRARQGKSFLMNCLAGEREIFKISNEKESCTQGIDISSKWLSLSDFSKLDGGKHIGGRTEGIRIGFVDAEGQGDKDVSYDANLICPILLASKCVIFNWKGDLQKDHILSTLGIMARAAQNIATESAGAQKSKFGHLHIIFRDWQAVKTDEEAVFHTLLGIENTTEGTTRDLIRADLLSSFESIKVWLFDPPSEYTRDLKSKLVYENTSHAFRTQVRALREALAQQLKEPTYLAGNVLTGRTYIPLTENIAEALNSGQVVLPSSAYLNMMRQEAQQLTRQYETELKAQVTQLLQSFENKAGELFITRSEALSRFAATEKTVQGRFQARIADVVGNVAAAPGTPVTVILGEYATQLQDIHTSSEAQFLALYSQHFHQWIQSSLPGKQAVLAGTLTEAADVADALLCAVSARDIGTLDSADDPVDSYADAVCAEVLAKMVTLVDKWLLLSLPQFAMSVACDDKGHYFGGLQVLKWVLHLYLCFF